MNRNSEDFTCKSRMAEVLIRFFYRDTVSGTNERDLIHVSGKQYCWLDESDYESLKRQEPLKLTVGQANLNWDLKVELRMEKIETQSIIDLIVQLGPGIVNSVRINIVKKNELTDLPYLVVEKAIKSRDYPKDQSQTLLPKLWESSNEIFMSNL